jgi:mevalonate kinase
MSRTGASPAVPSEEDTGPDLPPLLPASLPVTARAPGKCIVFGEHGVVRGTPELLFALDLATQVVIQSADRTQLNGDPRVAQSAGYFRTALEDGWALGPPISVRSTSRVPRASGLGSSAAFVTALTAGLGAATGGIDRAALARRSFAIEQRTQGIGSPGDTTASVAGGFVTLNSSEGSKLWELEDGTTRWIARRIPDPGWIWVVAYTGIPRAAPEAIRAVRDRLEQPDGPELLRRFESVAHSGIRALRREDRDEVGRSMTDNHRLLQEVGVSHPRLEALLAAASPAMLGGKLTGAGRGGSVVVLPRPGRELELARRIARAGGVPYVVRPSSRGAEIVAPAP